MNIEIMSNYILPAKDWDTMKPLHVTVKNIKVRLDPNAIPATKSPFDLLLRVYSAALDDYSESSRIKVENVHLPVMIPELHPLKFPLSDIRFVRGQKLVLSLVQQSAAKEETVVGQAAFVLDSVATAGKSAGMEGSLQLSSRKVGEIAFEYSVAL